MKPYRFFDISHISILFFLFSLNGCSKTPEQHFNQAQLMVQKGDNKAAIIELKTVLQAQPNNREARQLLGKVFLKDGAYPNAEKELSKARSLGVPDAQVLPGLADAYVHMGEPAKALALKLPESGVNQHTLAAFHNLQAQAHLMLGNRAEAALTIALAEKADPKLPELLLTRAKLALADKHKDQATQLLDEALKGDPKLVEALFLKAALLESENKNAEADNIYQKIIENNPTQFRAHLARAGIQLKKGDIEAADKSVQAAEKLAGKAPLVKYARGTLELKRGKLEEANSAFLEVLRVAPDHIPSMLAYAMTNYGEANYEQSISYAGKVLGVAPGNIIATKILASSQLKNGDIKGALKTLNTHISKYPYDAQLLALIGDTHLRAGDHIKATSYLDKAAALEPRNAAIKARQAAGHLASGNNSAALAALEAAVSINDKPGQADLALVMFHLKGNEFDKALQSIAHLEKKLPNNPITHNLRAAALLGKQDRTGARKAMEQALAIDSKFLPAAINLARMDIQDKNPDAARKQVEAVLEKDKNNVNVMMALADIAFSAKNEQEYISWLEKASKAQPNALQPKDRLIRFYLAKKNDKKALAIAKEAFSASPDKPETLSMLGSTQVATGDLNGAINTFTKWTEKAKASPDAYLQLGMAQIINKQLKEARASLERALQIKPDHVASMDALLRLEYAEKKPDAALAIAKQIQILLPKSPLGFEREADIRVAQKRSPEAVIALEQAMKTGAGPTALVKLYRALNLAGNPKAADQRLNNWIQTHPEDINIRLFAAQQYQLTNRNQKAISLYEEILSKSPQHVVALNNLATLYQSVSDKRALSTAEQAYKVAPQHPGVQDTLGWILVDHGQLPRALELLRAAVSKLPKESSVRYHYAVALLKSGNKAEARKELEQALSVSPNFPERDAAKSLIKSL